MPTEAAEPSKQMEEFLSWSEGNQLSYIANNVSMTKIIASQTSPQIAECLDTWYSTSQQTRSQRQSEIIIAMKELPNYAPQVIVLAVIEKACGKFERN